MERPRPPDAQLAKVLSHPMRPRILQVVNDRGEASPNQIAAVVGSTLGAVSYHVRILHDEGWLELVRTAQRRGATEHFYRLAHAPLVDDAEWERLPQQVRRQLAGQTLGQILKTASSAATAGGFDGTRAHISRLTLHLDEQAQRELAKLLADVLDEAAAIQRRSDDRRTASPSTATARSQLAILHHAIEDGD